MNKQQTTNFTNRNTGYLTKKEHDDLIKQYELGILKPTSKEKLIINPKVAYEVTDKMIEQSIPENIGSYKDLYGKINHFSKTSPVSNLLWDYLYFVDSDVFRPAALLFEKSKRNVGARKATYCSYPKGTTAYKKFWQEEFKRCTEGYEPIVDGKPCGLRIGGEFYFYLNYGQINKIIEDKEGKTYSVVGFPGFLTMDYYFYREVEARDNPSVYGLSNDYRKGMVVCKSRRKGHQQPKSRFLLKDDGWIKMGDVKIGDKVYGVKGELNEVTEIHEQGFDTVYEVVLRDGRVIECGDEHLWRVYSRKGRKSKRKVSVMRTIDIMNAGLTEPHYNGKNVKYKYYIEPIEPIPFKKKPVGIDPYIIGYLIGDGNLTKQMKVSIGDEDKEESLNRILSILNDKYDGKYKANHSNGDGFNYRLIFDYDSKEELRKWKKYYNAPKAANSINPLYQELKKYNLNCKSEHKRIPNDYLINDEETRLSLLQGLLDSDGSISKTGGIDFGNKSKDLVQDVADLCRSLGIHCTFKGDLGANGCYRIYIHTNKPVFRLKRKLARLNPKKDNWEYTPIVDIRKTDRIEEQQCITVDSEDHMYLTDGYTPTHNSYKAAASSVWIMAFNNNYKVGIASAPDTKQTDAALCAAKTVATIDHLSNYTPFGRKELGDVRNNGGWKNEVSSVTKTKVNITLGIFNTRTKEKRGRQSSLVTLALSKDDAASGEGLTRLYFEEAGKTSNLNKAWGFARETMKAGSYYRGLAIIFGCFTGDTMVFNKYGKAVEIKDLRVDDGIVGFSSRNLMPQTINTLKEPFKKECVKIKTQYGTISCSIDHPLLVTYYNNTKYKYFKDETGRDSTAYIRNNRSLSCWYERADKLTKDHAILIPDLSKAASSILFGSEELSFNMSHTDNDVLMSIIDYIHKHNELPDIVWQLNKKSTWGFVSALFDMFGDGLVYKKDFVHGGELMMYRLFLDRMMSSEDVVLKEKLSKSIKMLLYKLGVLAYTKGDDQTINSICGGDFKKAYEGLSKHDLYISNPVEVLDLFIEHTHFQLKELREVSKNYTPTMMSVRLSRNVNTLENLSLTEDYLFPEQLYFIDDVSVKENDMFDSHIENVYKFKVLGSPKKLKEKQVVYNLNCSPNHNYLANGFIAGNTGGEMVTDSGGTGRSKAFASLFNNPEANDLAAFDNIYDYQRTGAKCGYFVSDMWANFGASITLDGEKYFAMDDMGNAFFWVAEMALNKERIAKMPPNTRQSDYNLFLTQRCKTPSEAFFATKGSVFNTADLIGVQSRIESSNYGFAKYYTVGELEENDKGIVSFIPDLEGKLTPILSMNYDNSNKEGALIVYEQPKKIDGIVPNDAYIITCDPIGQDNEGGKSLVSIYVLKTPVYNMYDGFGYEGVVASYIGRKQYNPMTYARNLLLRLSKYYNAKITYENDRDGGILQDFTHKGELHRLLPSPSLVMSKHLPNSKTSLRKFGHSMATTHHKVLGETILNEWLDYRHPTVKGLNYKDEYVEKVGPRNMDLIKDQILLEQLIGYNRDGNFDAVMAIMGGIIQMKELYDVNLLENKEKTKENIESVKRWMNKVLKNNNSDFDYNYIT